jgi:hypothetical protein
MEIRMKEINPDYLNWQSIYMLLIGSVVPRSIEGISSFNPADNLI